MTAPAPLSPSAHRDTFCRDHLPPPETWPELVFDLPELHYPDRLNAASALLDGAIARHGADRPCVSGAGTSWTYGELRDHAHRVAAVLVDELGVVPGNRVLLRGSNTPWLAACWLGVLTAGAVAVTTMAALRAAEIAAVAGLARPSVALCDARDLADLRAAAVPGTTVVAYGRDGPDDLVARCAARDPLPAAVPTAADDVALLALTSGTTGRPKATMHFHRDLLAVADTFSRHVVRPRPDDVFSGTPPLGFTFGLGGLLVFPLRAGASTVLLDRTPPSGLADAVAEHGITVLSTAPTAYRALLAAGGLERLAGLRRCVSAGEALPAPVWREFHERTGIRIIDGIGSTEMLHVFVSAADDDIRPGATGRAVPGYRAAVLDDHGRPVPDGTPGHLAVIGPTGCRYLGGADARSADAPRGDPQGSYVRHGWNHTGDTYVRDADGYLHHRARTDDMIVSSGYNIAGPEVEQALLTHPDVLEAAVVGTPDEVRGTVVHAFVVLRDGAPRDAAGLQDHVKATIAPYKYPRAVTFTGALPRTATGKLQRHRLRAEPPR